MNKPSVGFNAAMGQFQKEVVRWNRQINLVSRKDTLRQVADLIGQCRDAWKVLDGVELSNWGSAGPVWYFDLGSGGGLPGYVWHQMLSARFDDLHTWLVEPREKRAWFLERLNKITPEKPFQVWNARWGESLVIEGATPARVLISMKALRLSDPVVLAGFNEARGKVALPEGGVVAIARFYPPGQQWSPALVEDLEIASEPMVVGDYIYSPVRQRVVSPNSKHSAAASLVLSVYRATS